MSTKNLHIVQKQVIDITLPNANAVFDWEVNQRTGITSMIKDQLEKCFDEWDKTDDHLIIDKLDLDLGIFHLDTLQSEMPVRLYTELQKKLNHYVNVAAREGIFSGCIRNTQEKPDSKNTQKNSSEVKQTGFLFSDQQGRLEALFFFLNKGFLPWWGLALADWDATWMQQLTTGEINSFKNFLAAGDARIIQRIITQFDDDFMHRLLGRMEIAAETGSAWNWLQEKIKTVFLVPYKKSLSLPAIRVKFWSGWIAHIVDKLPSPDLHMLFEDDTNILMQLFSAKATSAEIEFIESDEIPAIWREELKVFKHQIEEKKSPEDENKLLVQDKPQGVRSKKKINIEEETETMFVNDAGLIILHPFLIQLFRNCGWLDNNKFIDDYAQTMATYALHYLATGNIEAMEYELMFPKFLTGIDWEQPLMPVEYLNDAEKAACNELLIEVVKYWEPLRNTSPDGLREGFLKRTGKLEHIYSGWHLTIEQKTLDILLNRLPWGTSLIKFPWMPQMLTVTWQ